MAPTSDARPVYHGGPPHVPAEECPDLFALWGEREPDYDDPDDDGDPVYGTVGYVVAMPDGRTYSISAEDDPRCYGLDGVGSHLTPEGAARFYRAELIRLVPMRPLP